MTGKERIAASLNHQEPDRVPIIIGQTNATGMKMKVCGALEAKLGLAPTNPALRENYIYKWPELGTANPSEALLQAFGSDARSVLDNYPQSVYTRAEARDPHSPFIDDWGVGQCEIEEGRWFMGIHPMANATTIKELDDYPWPDMNDPTRLVGVAERARALHAENQYAIMGCPWLLFPLERAMALQGMDRFMENMLIEPEFALALLWKAQGLCKTLMGNFLNVAGDYVDIIKIGDDLGTQESLMISPALYREMLKPVHADLIRFIKSKTKAKVFFHSDGDIFDIIPDLIEIGVDILNPVQSGAGRMSNLKALKETYGRDMSFCGAIDTQAVLPRGTPQEVREHTKNVIRDLAPGGGYILSAVHTIMDEVSADNVLAMLKSAKEFGTYPIA